MLTREQVRAARGARGWNVRELAAKAGISFSAVSRYENGADARGETLRRIQTTLEGEGIIFTDSGQPGISWDADAPKRWAAAGQS